MFPGPGLAEEGVEGVIATPNCLVTGHLTIRLDPVFQTVQFPAGIADLHSGLAEMDGDTFTLKTIRITFNRKGYKSMKFNCLSEYSIGFILFR